MPIAALKPGDAGTWQTVEAMRGLVVEALTDPYVRAWAVSIVEDQPRNPSARIAALRAFLVESVRFVDDPVEVEWVQSPATMLRSVERYGLTAGDCDDVATLAAALGGVVGLPSRFVLLAFEHPAAPFAHVYAELLAGSDWMELDTTRQQSQLERHALTSREVVVPCVPVDLVPPSLGRMAVGYAGRPIIPALTYDAGRNAHVFTDYPASWASAPFPLALNVTSEMQREWDALGVANMLNQSASIAASPWNSEAETLAQYQARIRNPMARLDPQQVAWGLTGAFGPTAKLYLERLAAGGDLFLDTDFPPSGVQGPGGGLTPAAPGYDQQILDGIAQANREIAALDSVHARAGVPDEHILVSPPNTLATWKWWLKRQANEFWKSVQQFTQLPMPFPEAKDAPPNVPLFQAPSGLIWPGNPPSAWVLESLGRGDIVQGGWLNTHVFPMDYAWPAGAYSEYVAPANGWWGPKGPPPAWRYPGPPTYYFGAGGGGTVLEPAGPIPTPPIPEPVPPGPPGGGGPGGGGGGGPVTTQPEPPTPVPTPPPGSGLPAPPVDGGGGGGGSGPLPPTPGGGGSGGPPVVGSPSGSAAPLLLGAIAIGGLVLFMRRKR